MDENILDFVLLRIQNELDKYAKSKTIPHDLLEGAYSIDDIKENYYEKLSPKHKKIADKLIKDYTCKINSNLSNLKQALRKEYETLINGLETDSLDFKFPSVLVKYRSNINPVRALYYETREMIRSYNYENHYHHWLLSMMQDKEFNNKIIDSLTIDIKRLEKVVSRYYLPLTKYTTDIPLELFHARQLIKDFRHYKNMFISVQQWDPEEE
jgi:hypothetical protein